MFQFVVLVFGLGLRVAGEVVFARSFQFGLPVAFSRLALNLRANLAPLMMDSRDEVGAGGFEAPSPPHTETIRKVPIAC